MIKILNKQDLIEYLRQSHCTTSKKIAMLYESGSLEFVVDKEGIPLEQLQNWLAELAPDAVDRMKKLKTAESCDLKCDTCPHEDGWMTRCGVRVYDCKLFKFCLQCGSRLKSEWVEMLSWDGWEEKTVGGSSKYCPLGHDEIDICLRYSRVVPHEQCEKCRAEGNNPCQDKNFKIESESVI